jgi:DNA-binding transcriptional regulator YdaS (Cro superfamily)
MEHPLLVWQKAEGLSNKELADILSVHFTYITHLYNDRSRRPSPALALRIEEATGGAVSRMELLYPEQKKGGQPNP